MQPLIFSFKAVTKFVSIVNSSNMSPRIVSSSTAIKFLFARKFDVQRAISLFEQHEQIRHREGLYEMDATEDPLKTELSTGKFTILVSFKIYILFQLKWLIFFLFFSRVEMSVEQRQLFLLPTCILRTCILLRTKQHSKESSINQILRCKILKHNDVVLYSSTT